MKKAKKVNGKKLLTSIIERELNFVKLVNTKENLSTIGLTKDQVKMLVEYIFKVIETGKQCSYRPLIYTVLGGVSYSDGMDMGLLDLNNLLFDIADERKK